MFREALDDGRQPVDRDVFTRELDYYQIRAASSGAEGSSAAVAESGRQHVMCGRIR